MDSFEYPAEILALNESTPLGRSLLPYFQLESGVTNINHGSVGAPPHAVAQALRHYEDRMEKFPDAWFRYENGPEQNRVIDELKKYLDVRNAEDGVEVGDLVLVRNTTFAINSIFRAWPWSRGDKLLILSEEYEMTKLAAKFVADLMKIVIVEVPVEFPINEDELIKSVEAALSTHGTDIKLAVFSHVSSMPAAIMPIARLIDLCRSKNVPAIIDGAHALGQVEISIRDLDPDFYVSCGHKWLMAAKGAAFLYAKKKWHHRLHPAAITYGYGGTNAMREFQFVGNGDYSAYFTLPTAIKFRTLLGEKRIRNYCQKLAVDAGKVMAEIWGTDVLIEDENQLGFMNNVRLPLSEVKPSDQDKFVQQLVKELCLQYKTFLNHFKLNDVWYARISAQIYNDISDYKMVANTVLKIIDQMQG